MRVLVAVLIIFAQPLVAAEEGYFSRYYKPGLLQRLAFQQTSPQASSKPGSPPSASVPSPAEKTIELELESPKLEAKPSALDQLAASVGVSNLVFGGTVDNRFYFPKDMLSGMYMIHVNELFITTNIGDHISILAEQLLMTSDLGTTVGQDHGFVYATISSLPVLPEGTAFRVGRMRLRYGIDAKLDGPANPLRTPEYKTLGILSDRAIEIAGFFGPMDYVVSGAMGPDFVLANVASPDGSVAGDIKVPFSTSFHPIYARVGLNFSGNIPSFGFSGFYGDTYPVIASDTFQAGEAMLFGGFLEQHRVIRKARGSFDARWNYGKLKLAGEVTLGQDSDAGITSFVQDYYLRADYAIIPEKFTVQLQYDRFIDGRPNNPAVGALGLALTYNLTDESWLRVFGQMNERLFAGESSFFVAGTQLLLAF
jgi:hypothetical protein